MLFTKLILVGFFIKKNLLKIFFLIFKFISFFSQIKINNTINIKRITKKTYFIYFLIIIFTINIINTIL